jgi:hypothetical protein
VMTPRKCAQLATFVFVLFGSVLATVSSASAGWNEQVLYSFQGIPDGSVPVGSMVFDKSGNLYGATTDGGSKSCASAGQCGTVFQLTPPAHQDDPWTETVLYVFKGNASNDGATPVGGLVIDSSGNLYGTTAYGGTGDCVLLGSKLGCGAVYELSPPAQKGGVWTETVLYSFPSAKQGYFPNGDLVFDRAGNLYGATTFGGGKGSSCDGFYQYCGAVFKLSPPKQKGSAWTEKVLHSFAGVATGQQSGDGANPNGGLVLDSKGAVYGTTYYGGDNQKGTCQGGAWGTGCGIVFKLTPPTKRGGAWTEKMLYLFQGGQDGADPAAGVVLDTKGKLYGTAYSGGYRGYGTVFCLSPPSGKSHSWAETELHLFSDDRDGSSPDGGLILDARGGLYGTVTTDSYSRGGLVFTLKPPTSRGGGWTLKSLHGFAGSPDGAHPESSLVLDKAGNLYGTTQWGGTGTCGYVGCGTVFELSP